jgi:acyl dehydratase
MDKTLIGSFVIDQAMSEIFGQASGDTNPLHLDPIVARRYQFGSTVIHGVSGTLMSRFDKVIR